MKFVYVDESGDQGQGDIFVMVGLMIDAYSLRKCTAEFDKMLTNFLQRHPSGTVTELKTKAFINGSGNWNKVSANDRKKFLADICDLAKNSATAYGIAISLQSFNTATTNNLPFKRSYFQACAMFVSALIQKKMQKESNNKGLTVLVFDNNAQHMPAVTNALYECDAWYDGIYQFQETKKHQKVWHAFKDIERFNQIINTAFSINSEHSSLIQVADAVSYIYRRHLELCSGSPENWTDDGGEKAYYEALVTKLETRREKLGRTPDTACIQFFKTICHPNWSL